MTERTSQDIIDAERRGFNKGFDACWKMFDKHLVRVMQDRSERWAMEAMQMVSARAGHDRLKARADESSE